MRRSNQYPRFSLRTLFRIHSSPSYTKKHHSHRSSHQSTAPRRSYYPPRAYVPAAPSSYSYHPSQADPTPPPTYKPKHKHKHRSKSKTPYITSLPPELKHSLHSHLDPVSSACLGLSSRNFYPIHYSQHPQVSLFETTSPPPPSSYHSHSRARQPLPLAMLLRKDRDRYGQTQWCPPADEYALDWKGEKFVRRSRAREDRPEKYVWDEGRREREQEMRRLWGREGRLMRRSGYYRDLDVGGYRWR